MFTKLKAMKLKNATVIEFDNRGCMGELDLFKSVGVVEKITKEEIYDGNTKKVLMAHVRILKTSDGDARDKDLGVRKYVVEDGSLQQISNKLFYYSA